MHISAARLCVVLRPDMPPVPLLDELGQLLYRADYQKAMELAQAGHVNARSSGNKLRALHLIVPLSETVIPWRGIERSAKNCIAEDSRTVDKTEGLSMTYEPDFAVCAGYGGSLAKYRNCGIGMRETRTVPY